jgi:hypothetical protein
MNIHARIQYINIETEIEWELSFNDKKLNGTSINILKLINMDGKLSMVSIKETSKV